VYLFLVVTSLTVRNRPVSIEFYHTEMYMELISIGDFAFANTYI